MGLLLDLLFLRVLSISIPVILSDRNNYRYEIGEIPQNAPETWEVRDSQDSQEGTFDEMPDSREKEYIEPISSRKTEHQARDGVAIPQSQL